MEGLERERSVVNKRAHWSIHPSNSARPALPPANPARSERPLARAGEDEGAHAVVAIHLRHGIDQVRPHGGGPGIHGLGPAEGDHGRRAYVFKRDHLSSFNHIYDLFNRIDEKHHVL